VAVGHDAGVAPGPEAGLVDGAVADAVVADATATPPVDAAGAGAGADAAAAADLAAPADVTAGDGGPVDGASADVAPGAGQVRCGEGHASSTNLAIESLVVVPDGTVYYVAGSVGRIRPGMPDEPGWARYNAGFGGGIAYDPRTRTLYLANRGRIAIATIQVAEAGPANLNERRVMGGGVYGMTLGEDGALYYLDEWNGSIYRIVPRDWSQSMVATGLPSRPHALAFGPDGWLYVTQSTGPDVWRVKLEGGKEVMREHFATVGRMHGRGIAFDADGRLYVSAEDQVSQFDRQGQLLMTFPGGGGGIDFGAGALSCGDLYVAGDGVEAIPLPTRGMDVPWHRAP
jgi:sugar lactone lactonase YvrE